jgi:hypothetical protein
MQNALSASRRLAALPALAFLALAAMPAPALAQKPFLTPDAAAQALKAATAKVDEPALRELFGPEFDRIKTADPNQFRDNIERVHKAMNEFLVVSPAGPDRATLAMGFQGWPFPIPLKKDAQGAWKFDAKEGGQEVLNRRIGANELKTIETLHAYVGAQRLYASRPRGDGPLRAFAQKIRSTPGRHDGLYWESKPGEEESPFGPLVPDAARRQPGQPYFGYIYRILTAQGAAAPGGAYSYVINGNMIAGFAMVAYPASYGNTGIMTFIVNHYGDVYQKDLGKETATRAAAIRSYNPDATWNLVQSPRR